MTTTRKDPTMTTDLMSDPTEVLGNIQDLLESALRRGDKTEANYLANLINQIQSIWTSQQADA
jgi:hypothetical protein